MLSMKDDPDLRDSLRALKEAFPQQASPSTEQHLLARFRERQGRSRRWAYTIAAAAAVICVLLLFLGRGRREGRSHQQTSGGTAEFIALPYADSGVPLEQPVIVRMDIPVSELGSFGVQSVPSGRERVKADLLVGQDGVARAVRFVQ